MSVFTTLCRLSRYRKQQLLYAKSYQDLEYCKLSIRNLKRLLDWTLSVPITQTINETLDFSFKPSIYWTWRNEN